jgi:hypothetical protein
MRAILRSLIVLLVCMGLPASYAFAQGKGHGQGGGKYKDNDQGRTERVDRDRDRDRNQDRDDRDQAGAHVHKGPGHVELGHIFPPPEAQGRPPGWDKGKKTGWGNCDVPPGQAKKVGCEPQRHSVRRRRYQRSGAVMKKEPKLPAPRTVPPDRH